MGEAKGDTFQDPGSSARIEDSTLEQLPPAAIEPRIQQVADDFLRRLQAGDAPDRLEWEERHPELMPFLGRRLAFIQEIAEVARRLEEPLGLMGEERPEYEWDDDEEEDDCEGGGDGEVGESTGSKSGEADGETDGDSAAMGFPPLSAEQRLKCPQCGDSMTLSSSGSNKVKCGSCGGNFRVVGGALGTNVPGAPKRIGRFEILDIIGRGAFGTVYRAFDPVLQQVRALKVPRRGCMTARIEEEQILAEARSAARLRHANIVQVFDVRRYRGSPYLVCEYIEGTNLEELTWRSRMPFRESAGLMAEIADAIDYAHAKKVVHRDLKPSNILLDKNGRPYITDFGLARHGDVEITITMEGDVIGTPAYMSPEQADGKTQLVGPASDVYSLGAMLYCLLTGTLPFSGSKAQVMELVIHAEPRAPRAVNGDVPRELEVITLKAMAKRPELRYESAGKLAEDLRRWLRGEPIMA